MPIRRLVLALAVGGTPLLAQANATTARPADHAGLYRIEPSRQQRDAAFDMAREFAFFRLLPDGRVRMEELTVDTRGERIAPTVRVGGWTGERWSVRPAGSAGPAAFCLPAPATPPEPAAGSTARASAPRGAACLPYDRDPTTGDLVLRMGNERLALRRVIR
ncbi:MAG: hypothetical protein MUF40_06990 [Gemmatimonadaceae bacterium]|jgi:hypothetical protein|nr:hypothetical protein [Gemmatimonadaceae bacterium]